MTPVNAWRGAFRCSPQVPDEVAVFEGFQLETVETEEVTIRLRRGGSGPPLLLLHGFPQTHAMWSKVAPRLAQEFTVVCPDLRGYGGSSKPESSANHETYSKRAMARDQLAVMRKLGFGSVVLLLKAGRAAEPCGLGRLVGRLRHGERQRTGRRRQHDPVPLATRHRRRRPQLRHAFGLVDRRFPVRLRPRHCRRDLHERIRSRTVSGNDARRGYAPSVG